MRPVAQGRISKSANGSVFVRDSGHEVVVLCILLAGRRNGAGMNANGFTPCQKIEHIVDMTGLAEISPAALRRMNPMVKWHVSGVHAVIDDHRRGALP